MLSDLVLIVNRVFKVLICHFLLTGYQAVTSTRGKRDAINLAYVLRYQTTTYINVKKLRIGVSILPSINAHLRAQYYTRIEGWSTVFFRRRGLIWDNVVMSVRASPRQVSAAIYRPTYPSVVGCRYLPSLWIARRPVNTVKRARAVASQRSAQLHAKTRRNTFYNNARTGRSTRFRFQQVVIATSTKWWYNIFYFSRPTVLLLNRGALNFNEFRALVIEPVALVTSVFVAAIWFYLIVFMVFAEPLEVFGVY